MGLAMNFQAVERKRNIMQMLNQLMAGIFGATVTETDFSKTDGEVGEAIMGEILFSWSILESFSSVMACLTPNVVDMSPEKVKSIRESYNRMPCNPPELIKIHS